MRFLATQIIPFRLGGIVGKQPLCTQASLVLIVQNGSFLDEREGRFCAYVVLRKKTHWRPTLMSVILLRTESCEGCVSAKCVRRLTHSVVTMFGRLWWTSQLNGAVHADRLPPFSWSFPRSTKMLST